MKSRIRRSGQKIRAADPKKRNLLPFRRRRRQTDNESFPWVLASMNLT
jgi:hypothetical protein